MKLSLLLIALGGGLMGISVDPIYSVSMICLIMGTHLLGRHLEKERK